MLKRFEVTNFKGFKDTLVFDLSARDYAFNPGIVKSGFVSKAIIYGKNGVGKSSLGIALFDIVAHLTDKERMNKKYIQNYRNMDSGHMAVVFKYYFQFDDEEVVSAVRWHTTGNDNMTVTEKIVYLADYIDESRKF